MNKDDIKKAGLKITLPRTKILKILETANDRHMGAEDIYNVLTEEDEGAIALATVYRVLTQFEAAGLVIRHNFASGQAIFELNNSEHHDHMVCLRTGKIVEFHDEIIEQRQREIAKAHGFEISDHALTLYGEFEDKI
ncbi:MAG TPA: ferric iron uptake transcriptional regulator [Leucothrix mucor]|uniref:Ferric uptake regulation protein n=1 Tax=Leucothrix mucor TaxID=45248 RepID=A0A7V2WWG1_LEUMU|nr:ferric iron uptake transcriptional regulator [Leucothrix mucor]